MAVFRSGARDRAGSAQERWHQPLPGHSSPADTWGQHAGARPSRTAPPGTLRLHPSRGAQQDWSLGEVSRSPGPPLKWPLSGSCPCGRVDPAHSRRAEGGGQAAPRLQGPDTGPSTGTGEGGAHGGNEANQGSGDGQVHTQADTRTHTRSPTNTLPHVSTHTCTPRLAAVAEGTGATVGDRLTPSQACVHNRRPTLSPLPV